jgi:hypothetical protein
MLNLTRANRNGGSDGWPDEWKYLGVNKTSTSTVLTEMSTDENIYWKFSNAYRPIHGWLSTGVCLFGIPSNLLNIIVLTRSNMITSPTNLILTGLAFSDLLTMMSSLVFGVYFYIIHLNTPPEAPTPDRDTFFWTHFAKIHVMSTVTFHSISIWLTVYLACFRYIYIASSSSAACGIAAGGGGGGSNKNVPPKSSNRRFFRYVTYLFQRCLLQCRTYNFTLLGIFLVCIFCIVFCFPAYG